MAGDGSKFVFSILASGLISATVALTLSELTRPPEERKWVPAIIAASAAFVSANIAVELARKA